MADKLTPKQEKFAQKYVELSNASEAYKQSYNPPNSTDKTIWENASRTLADSKVLARVMELQQSIADRHGVTIDSLIAELEEARALAKETKQPSAMVGASLGKGKFAGLDKSDGNTGNNIYIIATGIDAAPNNKS